MADNVTVSNNASSNNPDYNAATTELSDGSHAHTTRLDYGAGTEKRKASLADPFPMRPIGNVAEGSTGWDNPAVMAWKDVFTGASRVPSIFFNSGIPFPLMVPLDIDFNFPRFRATGETSSFVGSTDNTYNNARYLLVRSSGAVVIDPDYATTAAVTSVGASATNVTLLSSNGAARIRKFVNDSDKNAYIKYGATASLSSFTELLLPGGTHEIPDCRYKGQVDCIWAASPTGSMRITEV